MKEQIKKGLLAHIRKEFTNDYSGGSYVLHINGLTMYVDIDVTIFSHDITDSDSFPCYPSHEFVLDTHIDEVEVEALSIRDDEGDVILSDSEVLDITLEIEKELKTW